MKKVITAFFLLSFALANGQNAGEVMFVGFNADGNDGFAFVTLVNLANGVNIRFNDNEWNGLAIGGGGAFNGGEGSMTWNNNTGGIINAGTLVTINNSSTTPTATVGTISAGTIVLAGSNEVLYMFIGADASTPTTFLSAIANNGFSVGNGQLTNTGLAAGVNAVSILGDEDVMVYLNNTNCNTSIAACAATIANAANWDTQDGGGNQSNDLIFPDFPANVCDVAGTLFFPQTTYYSFASGAWDANTSWSLSSDGSTGAVAVGVWPRRTDNVVIRNSHTITVNAVNDNKSCGNSPNGLNRPNVSTFTGSADLMFYHTGDIIISNGGTLSVSEEIMLEGYTLVENGGTFTIMEDIINLGYLEVSTTATFTNTDDLILSGNSITVINSLAFGADDIYIDWTNATLCGDGIMNLGNGGPDPTVQFFNGGSLAQICSTFTITCTSNCAAFPISGTGNFSSGIIGPGGVGNANDNSLWLRANSGTSTIANGSPISTWNDQSGNTNHAAQASANLQPLFQSAIINGQPTIFFDNVTGANSDVLIVPDNDNLDNTNGLTILTVTRPLSLDNANPRAILSKRVGFNNNQSYSLFFFTGGNKLNVDIDQGNNRFPSVLSFVNGTNYITSLLYDGTLAAALRARLFVNGNLDVTATEASASIPNYASDLSIGLLNAADGRPFGGHIAEIVVYRRALNEAQRIITDNYLSAKYAISLTANDVYTMDNPGNGNYDFEVAGIGQAANGSNHRDARGSGVVRMWNPNNLANNEFLMWGHDNSPITSTTTASPAEVDGIIIQERLSRIWRVGEAGDVGTVSISFDFSGVGGSPLGSNLRLLIDRDGDGFGDNDVTPIVGSVSNGIAVFSGINFQNGDRFTLGNTDASVPLPVELTSFTAKVLANSVQLDWETASELNNDFFTIERSKDAELWEDIAIIKGAGTTAQTTRYQAFDNQPLGGVSFYRLRQTDFDGQFAFSNIVRAVFEGKPSIRIFPNPSSGIFTIRGEIPVFSVSIKVFNALGQELSPPLAFGKDVITLDISTYPPGVYLLKLFDGIALKAYRVVKQ